MLISKKNLHFSVSANFMHSTEYIFCKYIFEILNIILKLMKYLSIIFINIFYIELFFFFVQWFHSEYKIHKYKLIKIDYTKLHKIMLLIIYFKVWKFSFYKNIFCYIYIKFHNFDFKCSLNILCKKNNYENKSEKKRQQKVKKIIRHRKDL